MYIGYLIFQIIPLPLNWLEVIAPVNHALYSSIKIDKEFWPLSIDPSNSYFRILNCINFYHPCFSLTDFPKKAKIKPLIIHAPSNNIIKGTKYVIEAMNNLKKKI